MAVAQGEARLTYGELDRRANQIAWYLRGRGVGPDVPVAVHLDRSLELLVALLAVLKAGGAYVAIDPGQPAARVALILADTRAPWVLTSARRAGAFPAGDQRRLRLDADSALYSAEPFSPPPPLAGPDHLAYVAYTSGATGAPKGVAVPHRGVVRLLFGGWIELGPESVVLAAAPTGFDASTFELWGPLLHGGCCALLEGEYPTVAAVEAALTRHRVDTMWAAAALFNTLLDEQPALFDGLRQLIVGGEPLSPPHVRRALRLLPGTTIWNGYGPTECTTFATCHRLPRRLPERAASVPIGRPIANTSAYVLDVALEPVPVGVPGELYLGGAGLARGYLHRPGLTAQRFIPDPFTAGARLYRTGDRVRWLPDGTLELLGRLDDQVKIRGFRVEPGEVSAVLGAHPAVREALVRVVADERGERRLAAYAAVDPDSPGAPRAGAAELMRHLRDRLPEHMLPDRIAVLDRLPRGPSGKVDVAALPPLRSGDPGAEPEERSEPASLAGPIEARLAPIWREVLGRERIGAADDFFEMGGHSLKAIQLVARCNREFGAALGIRDVFESRTLARLAERLRASGGARPAAAEAGPDSIEPAIHFHSTSHAQRRMWFLNQLDPRSPAYTIAGAFELRGPFDPDAFAAAFRAVVARHESLRTTFFLLGKELRQRIRAHLPVAMELLDCSAAPDPEARSRALLQDRADFPFDLRSGPLVRGLTVRLRDDLHRILVAMHHAVADGWSVRILTRELLASYAAIAADEPPGAALPPAPRYRDHVDREAALAEGEAFARAERHWLGLFADGVPELRLPLDFPRPASAAGAGRVERLALDPAVGARLQQLAAAERVTLNVLVLAAWGAVLGRRAGQEDLTIGSLVAGRDQPELEAAIGMFCNFVPVRLAPRRDLPFRAYLAEVQQAALAAYEHQRYPFDLLVQRLRVVRHAAHNPIFCTMTVFHSERDVELATPAPGPLGFTATPLELEVKAATLDLKLDVEWGGDRDAQPDPAAAGPAPSGPRFALQYRSDLFTPETAQGLLAELSAELSAAASAPDRPLGAPPGGGLAGGRAAPGTPEVTAPSRPRGADHAATIGVAATFTAEPLAESLSFWCRAFGIEPRLLFAPYGQLFLALLDPGSALRQDGLTARVLLLRFTDWIRDLAAADDLAVCRALESSFAQLLELLRQPDGAATLVVTFPHHPSIVRSERVQLYLDMLQERLAAAAAEGPDLALLDAAALAARHGIEEPFDPVRDAAGHVPFTEQLYAAAGCNVARWLVARESPPFKVIAVDCDNTLWSGVCGEDGPGGVEIGPGHLALQRFLVERAREGMLLALCSNNAEEDVAAVLRLRPDMALREEHLAARRVNWRPKAESLEELARELQVGLDAFIFLDDAEVECVAVAAAHPEVLAIALPADPAQLPAFLEHVWAFDRARTTAEDRDRTGMVRAEQRRREARLVQPSLEEFLAGLELEVSFAPLAAADAPRAAQLTLRTNQFNLSGARRDEVEILALARRPGWLCRVVEVADRFGRYGLVGLLFAERQGEALRIDTLLLSCRVLGRGVEAALLGALREEAAAAGVGRIEAPLKLSPKNGPILDFLRRSGLAEQPGESGWIRFSCPTSALPGVPPHVRCSATRRPPEVAGLAPVAAARPAPEGAPAARDGFAVPAALKRLLLRPEQLLPLEHVSGAALARLRSPAVRPPAGPAFEPPAGEMERALAPVWCEVLGCQRVGRRDDFFWLGGDSLLATALVARIHGTLRREIGLAEVFQHSELAALARRLERGRAGGAPPIPREPARPDGEYPASSAQKRQFVLQRLAPESTGYNNSSLHRLCGPLDLGRLEAALRAAVERHEALRTTFALRGGQLVQLVNDDLPLDWEVERQPVAPGEEQEWAGARIRPFDLGRGPLLRVRLAPARPREPGGEEWLLLLDVHHAVADGASLQILAGELMRGYRGEPVRAPSVQYRDFAAWQERELAGDRGRRAAQHWLGELRGELPVLNLPADFGRRAFPSQLGDSVALDLPDPLRQAVAALALARGATPFMVLLSAYGVLLLKYTGQEDLVVGTPAAARLHDDLRGAVGMYANTLALRVRPDPAGTFGQLLGQVRERLLQGYPWQDYPFERLVERLDFPREPSRNPLFDTMFALQTLGPRRGELAEGIAFEAVELRTRTSKFDCTLDALDGPDGLRLVLEFAADLFRRETMERLLRHYVSLLQQICRDPEVRLAALDPLSPAEREHLVERLNRPRRTPRPGTGEGRTFDEAFEDQARSRPDALALVFRDQELTYGELGRRVNRLAGGLRRLGVGRGTVVGVLLRRSPEVVTAVLAVLRAGGAYLPIDPAHPAERVAWILRHGGAALLLTEPDLAARVPFAGPRVHMGRERFEGEPEAGPPRQHGSSDLAYVIYTSGTTGRPRGVMVEHRQLMNAGYGWKAEYFLDEIPANVLQLASISFDVFTGDLARAFLAGGTLVLCPEEDRLEPHALVGLIRRHEVTLLEATPQLALPLMEHAARGAIDLPSLRLLILGSDAVPIEDYRRLLARFGQQLRIVNSYGVTEAAIDSCYFEAAPGGLPDTVSGKVPIGRPMPGVRLHVLDQNLGLVPPGAVGELYVGGAGVARGYRGDPGQTAQRFLPDPFADGERLYRTGDVARWLESGDVEFLGRADRQVKIRGYRIEPGEIEHQLLEMEGVRRAAVVDFDGGRGERWLCAYLVAEAEITAQEMRAFLVRRLPEYMVPARLVLLEALPLSPNGKVDTRALPRPPAPSGSAPGIPGDAEPEAPLEKRLSALWCEVLGVPAVGRADSFFEMGGNSFSLLHLHGRVQAELAPDLRAADLFSYPTVEALARRIGELEAAARPSARAPLDGELQ